MKLLGTALKIAAPIAGLWCYADRRFAYGDFSPRRRFGLWLHITAANYFGHEVINCILSGDAEGAADWARRCANYRNRVVYHLARFRGDLATVEEMEASR